MNLNQNKLIPNNIQEKILNFVKNDDCEGLDRILLKYEEFNPFLYNIPSLPKQLKRGAPLTCVAAFYGSQKVLQYLLQINLNPSLSDHRGRTIAHFAIYSNNISILSFLNAWGIPLNSTSNNLKTPAHIASKFGCLDILKYFYALGIKMKKYDKQGLQPIHYALVNERYETVELLEQCGCSILAPMRNQTNIYITAIKRNRFGLLDYLLKRGVPQEQCEGGNYPLHVAVKAKLEDVTQVLLEHGADPLCQNKKLETPIHIAAKNGCEPLLLRLLMSMESPFPDPVDENGATPLHYAAKNGYVNIVNLLLDFDADIDALDHKGNSPLTYASKNRHNGVKDLLKSLGAYDDYVYRLRERDKKKQNYTTSYHIDDYEGL